jgi:hypothetical protein
MTMTSDAYLDSEEIIALMTGLPMDRAPVLIDRATGANAVCWPTEIGGIPGMCMSFGYVPRPGKRPRKRDNAWVGSLPVSAAASEVGISIVLGEVVRNATVHRRQPEPAPKPPAAPPKRRRAARPQPATAA